jgi:hypothetical protein
MKRRATRDERIEKMWGIRIGKGKDIARLGDGGPGR